MRYRRLWVAFGLVTVGSFSVLGYYGFEIYREAPPVPQGVVTTNGRVRPRDVVADVLGPVKTRK